MAGEGAIVMRDAQRSTPDAQRSALVVTGQVDTATFQIERRASSVERSL
jgi:hypothetical protein